MLNSWAGMVRRTIKPWLYLGLGLAIALGIGLGTAIKTPAISFEDILRGVQTIDQINRAVQLANLTDQQEVELGQQINRQLVSREFRMFNNPAVNQYVTQIGRRVVARSERPNLPYTFQVVDDRDINAFATMGGFIYITTGLLRAADNEAQVAGVLGHEAGHINGKHLIEQMRQEALVRGIATVIGADRDQIVGLGVNLALHLPKSREAEFDADQRGLRYMGAAGYARSAMPAFMSKLIRQSTMPEMFSTHPDPAARVSEMNRTIGNAGSGDGLNNDAYRSRLSALR